MEYKQVLLDSLETLTNDFASDELAYLALTSKVEFAIRDKLAFRLHRELMPQKLFVAREWSKTDIAILQEERPVALIELKAIYT